MAYGDLVPQTPGTTYVVGKKWRAVDAEQTRLNFIDHESRIVAASNVTLAGSLDYITLSGQVITRGAIDLTTDVTGRLPLANVVQGTALSVLGVTGNATANEASIVAASDNQVLRRSGTTVGFGAVDISQTAAITGALPLGNLPTNFAQIFKSPPITLTDAQTKALPTTPIQIVVAPSAGFHNKYLCATIVANTNAGAYTNVNATYAIMVLRSEFGPFLSYVIANDNTLTTPLARLSGILTTTGIRLVNLGTYAEAIEYQSGSGEWGYLQPVTGFASSDVDQARIELYVDNNGSGNFTGGNAANTIKVTVYYLIEAL